MASFDPERIVVLGLVVLLLSPSLIVPAISATSTADQLYSEIASTFAKVRSIEKEGGNVTGVVGQLNQALSLVSVGLATGISDPAKAQSSYQQAESLVQSVNQELPVVEKEGIATAQSEILWLAFSLIGLTAAGVGICLFGGRVFWALWIRTHKGWRVKKA
jgi:hypothetical protein